MLGVLAILSRYIIPAFNNTNTPVLIGLVLLLGGLVGAIVIAMYLPVFQLGRLL